MGLQIVKNSLILTFIHVNLDVDDVDDVDERTEDSIENIL